MYFSIKPTIIWTKNALSTDLQPYCHCNRLYPAKAKSELFNIKLLLFQKKVYICTL